ncbi:MAG: acyltransferase [Acidobacteriota bacterium]
MKITMPDLRRLGAAIPPEIDVLRGATILWVSLFHLYVDTRGVPGAEVGARAFVEALREGSIRGVLGSAAGAMAGLPSFRVDLFLLVTGLVLMLRPPSGAWTFWQRRFRSVLPSYWLGSLLTLAVIVGLSTIRALAGGAGIAAELQRGSLLAGHLYLVEPGDILRSLSVIGRFESQRTMQVVAPSMWYIVLVLQVYCVFPLLRRWLERAGPWRFAAGALVVTWCGRWLVFTYPPLSTFDPNATVIHFLPFRLAPLALGMMLATWMPQRRDSRRDGRRLGLLVPAAVVLLAAQWLSVGANAPGTLPGVIGPIVALVVALPGLWMATVAATSLPRVRRSLAWAGRHSMAVLVVQDSLRFAVGTAIVLGGSLHRYTWLLAVPYLLACLALARVWTPLPARLAARFWPPSPATDRVATAEATSS